jgi:hypothetical protein
LDSNGRGATGPGLLTDWPHAATARLGDVLVVTKHRLAQLPIFTDDGLAHVFAEHPHADLQVYTPTSDDPWAPVAMGDASPTALLQAIRDGRLWCNVLRVDRSVPELAELTSELFGEIAMLCADLVPESWRATLLVSSPTATVPYHVDAGPNILWHVRGAKRVFVYPADREDLLPRRDLEDVYVGEREEYLAYDPSFDAHAKVIDLEAGDVAAWPQNSPHRVENRSGLNVSLSCEFATQRSTARARTMFTNRFFDRRLGLRPRPVGATGVTASVRHGVYRVSQRLGLDRHDATRVYDARWQVDPAAPGGVTPLTESVRAAFSID